VTVLAPPVCAIDPGKKSCGVATFIGGQVCTMVVERGSIIEAIRVVKAMPEGTRFVVEGQFVNLARPSGINFPSLEVLIGAAMAWVHAIEVCGRPAPVRPKPGQWQGPMLRAASRSNKRGQTRSTKARAKEVCAGLWGLVARINGPDNIVATATDDLTEDERDALLIGEWYRRHGG
jgi:hypothetical protein